MKGPAIHVDTVLAGGRIDLHAADRIGGRPSK
jgi:hypothetical protein